MAWRSVVVGALLCWYGVSTWRQVEVWRSEVALWERAVAEAPYKPRVWVNYGVALAAERRVREAGEALSRGLQLASAPWVPLDDAAVTRRTVEANLRAWAR